MLEAAWQANATPIYRDEDGRRRLARGRQAAKLTPLGLADYRLVQEVTGHVSVCARAAPSEGPVTEHQLTGGTFLF